jgi:hypothetical protein
MLILLNPSFHYSAHNSPHTRVMRQLLWCCVVRALSLSLSLCQTISCGTTHCRPSPTVYFLYSQFTLPSCGAVSHPQPEGALCHGYEGPTFSKISDCMKYLGTKQRCSPYKRPHGLGLVGTNSTWGIILRPRPRFYMCVVLFWADGRLVCRLREFGIERVGAKVGKPRFH